jgi:hypothetical protein
MLAAVLDSRSRRHTGKMVAAEPADDSSMGKRRAADQISIPTTYQVISLVAHTYC